MQSSKDSPRSGALTAGDIIALRLGFKYPHQTQVGSLCLTPSVQRNSSQTTEAREKKSKGPCCLLARLYEGKSMEVNEVFL